MYLKQATALVSLYEVYGAEDVSLLVTYIFLHLSAIVLVSIYVFMDLTHRTCKKPNNCSNKNYRQFQKILNSFFISFFSAMRVFSNELLP